MNHGKNSIMSQHVTILNRNGQSMTWGTQLTNHAGELEQSYSQIKGYIRQVHLSGVSYLSLISNNHIYPTISKTIMPGRCMRPGYHVGSCWAGHSASRALRWRQSWCQRSVPWKGTKEERCRWGQIHSNSHEKNRFRPNIVDIPASKKKHKGIIICCISHVFTWHIKITTSEIQMLKDHVHVLSSLDIHPPSIEYEWPSLQYHGHPYFSIYSSVWPENDGVCVCREVTIYPSLSCPAPVGQSGRRWRAVMCSCRGFCLHSRSGVVSHVGGKAGFGLFTCLVPAKLLETWRIDVSRCVNPCIMALARNLVTCTNMCLSRDKEKKFMQPVVSKNEP